jgi:hypothetical protein
MITQKEIFEKYPKIFGDKEGYYMKTVGDRYVEYEDMEALNHVAKYALRSLNVQFEFEERQYY